MHRRASAHGDSADEPPSGKKKKKKDDLFALNNNNFFECVEGVMMICFSGAYFFMADTARE